MALFMVKTWMGNKVTPIYGAEWAGTSDPSWTRTDDAVGFSAPNPYYSGMSGSPSSPFDNIMPWSGMRRVTDASAGELVEIPKFYYKWTRDGVKMKLQISMSAFDGSHVSPAHADRGDGVGERDYAYVGRYKSASDYKSKSGYVPLGNKTRATYRSGIHNLGANVWQNDFAMYWTIAMLYLVEFANWNEQARIGYGGQDSGGLGASCGRTDSMPYHTGTILSSKTSWSAGIQYRYIEDIWANGYEYLDGIRFSSRAAYLINNPSNFNDDSGGVSIGTVPSANACISSWSDPSSITGCEYALIPATASGTDYTTYICDAIVDFNTGVVLDIGGCWNSLGDGFFSFIGRTKSWTDGMTGAQTGRLMVLPSSRLSA